MPLQEERRVSLGTCSISSTGSQGMLSMEPSAAAPPALPAELGADAGAGSTASVSWLIDVLPPQLLPKVASYLDSLSQLALFQTCHTLRSTVLSCAACVRLRPSCPEARMPVLACLLQLTHEAPGSAAHLQIPSLFLNLQQQQQHCTQLLPLLTVLHSGRVKELKLKVSGLRLAQATWLVARRVRVGVRCWKLLSRNGVVQSLEKTASGRTTSPSVDSCTAHRK